MQNRFQRSMRPYNKPMAHSHSLDELSFLCLVYSNTYGRFIGIKKAVVCTPAMPLSMRSSP